MILTTVFGRQSHSPKARQARPADRQYVPEGAMDRPCEREGMVEPRNTNFADHFRSAKFVSEGAIGKADGRYVSDGAMNSRLI